MCVDSRWITLTRSGVQPRHLQVLRRFAHVRVRRADLADPVSEDFALPFFCGMHGRTLSRSDRAVTTNITWSRMDVHTSGYAWRYIRASMSLAGLLPPLCENGDMLCDGGCVGDSSSLLTRQIRRCRAVPGDAQPGRVERARVGRQVRLAAPHLADLLAPLTTPRRSTLARA